MSIWSLLSANSSFDEAYTGFTTSKTKEDSSFVNEANGKIYVKDLLNGGQITSESETYLLYLALQAGDKETFDKIFAAIEGSMRGYGLPVWRGYLTSENRFSIMSDSDKNSALDADVLYTLALIEAGKKWGDPVYSSVANRNLTGIWERGIRKVGKYAIPKISEDPLTEESLYSPGYFPSYAFEVFHQFDKETSRNWLLVRDTVIEIEKLWAEGTNRAPGQRLPSVMGRNIAHPSFFKVEVDQKGNLMFYSAVGDKSSDTGFDGIREPLFLGESLLRTKDIKARGIMLYTARKYLDKIKMLPAESVYDIEIHYRDEKTGAFGFVKDREIAIASYMALAYAVSRFDQTYEPLYLELKREMEKITNKKGLVDNKRDKTVEKEKAYFDQIITLWAKYVTGVEPEKKTINFESYNRDITHLQEERLGILPAFPFTSLKQCRPSDPACAADLSILSTNADLNRHEVFGMQTSPGGVKNLGLSDDPSFDLSLPYNNPSVRLKYAKKLYDSQYLSAAVLEFSKVYDLAEYPKDRAVLHDATESLMGTLASLAETPQRTVVFWEGLMKKHPGNPYVRLGYAQALANLYAKDKEAEAQIICLSLLESAKREKDSALQVSVAILLSNLYLREAKEKKDKQLFFTASNVINGALNLSDISFVHRTELLFAKAEIAYFSANMLKDSDLNSLNDGLAAIDLVFNSLPQAVLAEGAVEKVKQGSLPNVIGIFPTKSAEELAEELREVQTLSFQKKLMKAITLYIDLLRLNKRGKEALELAISMLQVLGVKIPVAFQNSSKKCPIYQRAIILARKYAEKPKLFVDGTRVQMFEVAQAAAAYKLMIFSKVFELTRDPGIILPAVFALGGVLPSNSRGLGAISRIKYYLERDEITRAKIDLDSIHYLSLSSVRILSVEEEELILRLKKQAHEMLVSGKFRSFSNLEGVAMNKRVAVIATRAKGLNSLSGLLELSWEIDAVLEENIFLRAGDKEPRGDFFAVSQKVASGDIHGAISLLDEMQKKKEATFYSTDFYKNFIDTLISFTWSDNDESAVISLLLSLVDTGYEISDPSNQYLFYDFEKPSSIMFAYANRKEIKSAISQIIQGDVYIRRTIFEVLGERFSIQRKPEKSIQAYRMGLGLVPEGEGLLEDGLLPDERKMASQHAEYKGSIDKIQKERRKLSMTK
ncbi:hypothetical protein A3J90_04495 [candidate division WOR-1 bacterium RIFOXYC2_FULL_37_10]|nr:MAG: hypothetical protein A2246_03595 [candidate division WOR-1 bacterium RIFOXYA2_FULL_37_7]OGC33618.1 MAG: hypothetical protein A3J90_04495 [candidate division WOR-1 bacterium RIFOXYC2_FULL_37_10]